MSLVNNNITFIFSAFPDSVRLNKIVLFCKKNGYEINICYWNRYITNNDVLDQFTVKKMIVKRDINRGFMMYIYYFIYMIFLFNWAIWQRSKDRLYYAINFESAFPLMLASLINHRLKYVYDIWDEITISHNFPTWIKKILYMQDHKIRRHAECVIHVDESRLSKIDDGCRTQIVYNSPYDYFKKTDIDNCFDERNAFAVTGWLNDTRGLDSILSFAISNRKVKLIVVGEFLNKETEKKYLAEDNIEYHLFMPQNQLFQLIKGCKGVFSLYDPTIEINRLAASNKLYDAMMLGIPVICNNGILAVDFIIKNNIGFVVDYSYNDSWNVLLESTSEKYKEMGNNGRGLYLRKYEFDAMLNQRMLPILKSYFNK